MFHVDRIYAESSIVEKKELPGRRRTITVETRASNQRTGIVLSVQRKIVVPLRPEGETEYTR